MSVAEKCQLPWPDISQIKPFFSQFLTRIPDAGPYEGAKPSENPVGTSSFYKKMPGNL